MHNIEKIQEKKTQEKFFYRTVYCRKTTNRQQVLIENYYLGSKDRLNSTSSLAGTKDILRDVFNADSRLPQLIIPR